VTLHQGNTLLKHRPDGRAHLLTREQGFSRNLLIRRIRLGFRQTIQNGKHFLFLARKRLHAKFRLRLLALDEQRQLVEPLGKRVQATVYRAQHLVRLRLLLRILVNCEPVVFKLTLHALEHLHELVAYHGHITR